jgi:hypothetical protein
MAANELKSFEKRAKQEVLIEEHKTKCSKSPHFHFAGNDYFFTDGKYELSYVDAKGMPHLRDLTNFYVSIKEEIVTLPSIDEQDGAESESLLQGRNPCQRLY